MYSNKLIIEILKNKDDNINNKITIDDLSKEFYFNKDYIMRLFKKEIKITITDYINKKRIYNSLKDLRNTDNTILKVALNNGFTSQEYFSETFTKVIGTSPNIYRKAIKMNSEISKENLNIIRINLTNLIKNIKEINTYKLNVEPPKIKKFYLPKQKSYLQ